MASFHAAFPPPDRLADLFDQCPSTPLPHQTLVMGILNVTPDSFSDGGELVGVEAAVRRGLEMVQDGAHILDVGGESTRPGASPVPEAQELRRVLPVIEGLRAATGTPISIDTTKPAVARAALERGARIVNDVSGLRFAPELADLAAEHDAFLLVMHSAGTPSTMQQNPAYEDVVREVRAFLRRQTAEALRRGVGAGRLIVDPGIGFGKTPAHNLELLRNLPALAGLGYPVLVGTSRKAFLGRLQAAADQPSAPAQDRMEATAATVALAVAGGARAVRVHDVRAMARVARVADAVCRG